MAKKPGKYYINAALQSPELVDVTWGKGDHAKFRAKVPLPANMPNPIGCPYNLKGNGTEHAIVKWLKAVGVLVIVVAVFGSLGYLVYLNSIGL